MIIGAHRSFPSLAELTSKKYIGTVHWFFFMHQHWFPSGQWHIQVSRFIPKRRAKRWQSFQHWFATNVCPLSLVLMGWTMESLENSEVHIHQSLASPDLQWSWKNVFISGSYVADKFLQWIKRGRNRNCFLAVFVLKRRKWPVSYQPQFLCERYFFLRLLQWAGQIWAYLTDHYQSWFQILFWMWLLCSCTTS